MKRRPGPMLIVLGGVLLLLGLGMLNYTAEGKAEFHAVWAAEHGLPEPTDTVRYAGWGALVLGATMIVSRWLRPGSSGGEG